MKIRELRIYNPQSQFVYEVGKQALHHDEKEVVEIQHFPAYQQDMGGIIYPEFFQIVLEDWSLVTWNAGNVSRLKHGGTEHG